jgi:hypothetical protein
MARGDETAIQVQTKPQESRLIDPKQAGRPTREEGMHHRSLRTLLVVHGFITLAAGIVLAVAPGLIPGTVGVPLEPGSWLVAYLLAGAEFGIATLSFGGSRLTDPRALRLIAWSCIVFHGSTGVLEVYAYTRGVSPVVLGNVAARVIIIALFAYLSRDRA